jgi:hypothetical protein
MENEKITSVKEIPDALGISKKDSITALKVLKKEKYSRQTICDAVNRNTLFIKHMKKKQPAVGLLIETVRRQVRMDRNAYGWDKPNGNPVRDRLLEVGIYNPYHPDYVDKTLKRRV